MIAASPRGVAASAAGEVQTCPAPSGETLSRRFSVTAGGQNVPVYVATVEGSNRKGFIAAVEAKLDPTLFCDEAGFAYFDLRGSTRVVVTCPGRIEKAKLLPASCGITPEIDGNTLSFDLGGPANLTLEVNGNEVRSLHIFANPWEDNPPKAGDPNVIYFGPGIHETDNLKVSSGQTVYVAAGAIVRGRLPPVNKGGAVLVLTGSNITLCGRGIIDGSLYPSHSRSLLLITGSNILIQGVILRDASAWTMPIRRSDGVTVDDVKVLGYRSNSDGIDICNSHNVTVSDCFVRTWDDLVVVKTFEGQGTAGHILVTKCVLWNELAHALSIGAELREDVDDVRFVDCDVIHDKGREWTLRVYHCDSGHVTNVRFENIRIAESPRFISLWIGTAVWSRDPERGHIENVTFDNIRVDSGPAQIALQGFDGTHLVDKVAFDNVSIDGQPLRLSQIQQNAFCRNIAVTPYSP